MPNDNALSHYSEEDEWSESGSSFAVEEECYSEDDGEEDLVSARKPLVWLCQEGMIPEARKCFDALAAAAAANSTGQTDTATATTIDSLHRQVFQINRDGNSALHEILAGGTADTNAKTLCRQILDYISGHPVECAQLLSKQPKPKSDGRTCLHWAAWGNADSDILFALVRLCPEALLLRDANPKGSRTPAEIFQRYYAGNNAEVCRLLNQFTASWTEHRVRLAVHACAKRYFVSSSLRKISRPLSQKSQRTKEEEPLPPYTPFDKKDRKLTKIKPRPWFALSVLGYCLQREMKPLAIRILAFHGKRAAVAGKKRRRRASATSKTRKGAPKKQKQSR